MSVRNRTKGPAEKALCIAALAGTGVAITLALARRQGWLRNLYRSKLYRPSDSKSCKNKACETEGGNKSASASNCDTTKAKSLDEQLNKACAPAGATTTASPSASASSPDIGSDGATGSADTHLSVSTGSPASTSEASSGTSELQGSAPSVSNADEHARPFDIMTHEATTSCELTSAPEQEPSLARSDSSKSSCGSAINSDRTSLSSDEELSASQQQDSTAGNDDCASTSTPADGVCSSEKVKAYLAKDGLKRAEFKGDLGKGGFGNVELVAISLPDGTVLEAARKVLLQRTNSSMDELCDALQRELDGLAAAEGCQYAVQCLGFRMPTAEGEPAELLLSYADGGSVEDFLTKMGSGLYQDIYERSRPRRTGKNKDKYELLPYPGSTLTDEADMRGMLLAMMHTIKHMNSRGYVHFDLKPANLLFDTAPDGSKVFRVCDFNFATKLDSNGHVGSAPGGTRAFCAWEVYCQLQGDTPKYPITKAADIASAGLVLADAAGLHCLGGGTTAYLRMERDLPRRTPPALKELIEWMVAEDPAARPTPDQVLAHRWMTEQ
ncbi:hypothetical protein CHLRE_01g055457v5 [Chlamydomonas reinhardtii]|uniref:Protein kinase domain-containing protein n=1 Tax=Chlamydomonas reinhardtii TaxID=3055 RepID=A0A2K3E8D5_CHLRE|nr:uncharacterized protein CHLRE_01g055457v5 [Chlamydomonas reinhardtii]PNW89043.1 hypothetical protein CHLRE_01g055457v5 [Chlamydomonas reinhardtii]